MTTETSPGPSPGSGMPPPAPPGPTPPAPLVGGPGQPPHLATPAAASSPVPAAAVSAAPGAGDPAQVPGTVPDAAPGAQPATPAAAAAPTPERPPWLPEKFFGPAGADVESLGKAYSELTTLLGKRVGELPPEQRALLVDAVRPQLEEGLAAELRGKLAEDPDFTKEILGRHAPKAPESYEMPPALKDRGISLDLEHPVFKSVVDMGKTNGWSQEQVGALFEQAVELLKPWTMPLEQKMAAVGPDFEKRAREASQLANNLVSRQVEDPAQREAAALHVNKMLLELQSPEAFRGLEFLLSATGEKSLPLGGDGQRTVHTEESIRAMMRDPRYYTQGRRDPAFVAAVDHAWRALKGGAPL